MARSVAVSTVVALLTAEVALGDSSRSMCQISELLVDSVDTHLQDWDGQIGLAMNRTFNCSTFLEWVYNSRTKIRTELGYIRGNFTQEDEQTRIVGGEGLPTTAAMSYLSAASSLVSAQLHIHGHLVVSRRECLSEHLQLLFLMGLRRLKTLLREQLRQLWMVYQGTAELVRDGGGKWLSDVVEFCASDLHTMEELMLTWMPPPSEREAHEVPEGETPPPVSLRPGPPLPPHRVREPNGISLSTVEVLRRDTFNEWESPKSVNQALVRYVLPRDGHVADFCAGTGFLPLFLNDTGLVTAYAFDASPFIKLLTNGTVDHAAFGLEELRFWRSFDIVICLSAATTFAGDPEAWGSAWRTIEAHAFRGAILNCGVGDVRRQALAAAGSFAPGLEIDTLLSARLSTETLGICVFWRGGPSTSLQRHKLVAPPPR
eukprot:TRINITY_DN13742_c1_g1_i1.p1 TRINITY_DN13742_c1_g1~~TRINITY_DN13742_c1_g1_i1.p1  ORF type:complete len:430 (+),score=61.07 TRINITY_DN13742_c1_g1_i1:89-1378(+)